MSETDAEWLNELGAHYEAEGMFDDGDRLRRIGLQLANYRAGLEEIAANRHNYNRPAGAIAKAALAGSPLPR